MPWPSAMMAPAAVSMAIRAPATRSRYGLSAADRGLSPVSPLLAFGRSLLAKIDRLPCHFAQLASEELFQALAAARGKPGLAFVAPGKMPGAADRRRQPELTVRRMPVQQVFGARFGLDRQDAADQLDIQVTLGIL